MQSQQERDGRPDGRPFLALRLLSNLTPLYRDPKDDNGRTLLGQDAFSRLADQFVGIQGSPPLSINDLPEIRALIAAFDQKPVETTYGISRQAAAKAELLISIGR